MEKFKDILTKKEEAYIKQSDIKEERKTERFKLLMDVTDKKLTIKEKRALIKEKKAMLKEKKAMLGEKKVKITTDAEDAKILSLKVESSDAT
ncbi:hypothetical protein D1007_25199 [Hordeum vulgare]|nr:hypothetical protein D1007_25199 [Hordeum vulgare]